jgi:hypothetical protein
MKDVRVGDWVRFQRDHMLILGVVLYVRPCKYFPYGDEAVTDIGTVHVDSILERRAQPHTQEAE